MPARSLASSVLAAAVAAGAVGCARPAAIPPAGVVERARAARSYSARIRVRLDGPELRARTAALVAFERPDSLRVEVPGPTGARLVAVARNGSLTAVFPAERAFFAGEATSEGLARLLGVPLDPPEVMGVLVGAPPVRVRDYRAQWGPVLPRRIEAMLPDGGRLKLVVEEAEAGTDLPPAAFAVPPHAGYRPVDAAEARSLWSAR